MYDSPSVTRPFLSLGYTINDLNPWTWRDREVELTWGAADVIAEENNHSALIGLTDEHLLLRCTHSYVRQLPSRRLVLDIGMRHKIPMCGSKEAILIMRKHMAQLGIGWQLRS
jgi:hypothetical protein